MSHTMETVDKRLSYLSTLEDGWLDGDGSAIKPIDIENCRMFLEKIGPEIFSIFPNPDGGITIESIEYGTCITIDFNEDPDVGSFTGFIFNIEKK